MYVAVLKMGVGEARDWEKAWTLSWRPSRLDRLPSNMTGCSAVRGMTTPMSALSFDDFDGVLYMAHALTLQCLFYSSIITRFVYFFFHQQIL